jgi:hypothetical protein
MPRCWRCCWRPLRPVRGCARAAAAPARALLALFALPAQDSDPASPFPRTLTPQMTKSTSLTATDRKACCGPALDSATTCNALCLGATQDPATCVPTGRRRRRR